MTSHGDHSADIHEYGTLLVMQRYYSSLAGANMMLLRSWKDVLGALQTIGDPPVALLDAFTYAMENIGDANHIIKHGELPSLIKEIDALEAQMAQPPTSTEVH